MAIPLAILIVEDTESDAQLILRLLRKADYELTSKRVETALEMRATLEEQNWDIVISDYSLPQFDGTAALALLQELRPDIPFIAVSGTIGEETAVAMMIAGAHDYLMKDNLARLVPAVKRELAQAEVRRKRRQAETELRVNEARWRTLIENSADAIAILAMDGTILYEGPTTQHLSGYSPDELTGHNIMEELHPDDQAMAAEFFNRVLQQAGVPILGQVRAKHKDQTWRWVECTGTNLLDNPIIHGIVLNYRDITGRKQAEKKIVQMKRLYAILSQVNQTIVRVKDRDELYRSICNVAVKFGEFSLAWVGLLDEETGDIRPVAANGLDITQWPFPTINIHKGTLKDGLIATAIHTSKVVTSDDIQTDGRLNNLYNQSQKYTYHSSAAIPFYLRSKEIGVVSLVSSETGLFKAEEEIRLLEEMRLDISFALDTMENEKERKRAEEKVQLQNRRLKVLREIDTAILAADALENIVDVALSHIRQLVNCRRAALTLFDEETNEAEIFSLKEDRTTSLQKGTRLPLALFEDLGKTLTQDQLVLIKELAELPVTPPPFQTLLQSGIHSVCILPLYSQGKLTGTFGMFSESSDFFDEEKVNFGREVANQVSIAISEKRLIEDLRILNVELEQRVAKRTEDLNQTNIELEHANRAKDEFLANMSHELRTPLNSILGLSETLLEQRRDPLTEHQQQSLQIIESSGDHLLELINDVLDLSKIEAGKFDYYPQIVEVNALCRSSLAFVKEQAIRKSVTLNYKEDDRVTNIYADPRRTKQMLVNLLNNAVKFTPEHGAVNLEVYEDEERDLIQFSVIDTGIGIAEHDLKQLFQPFVQVDSTLNRQFEGTGLGLSLVQKLADLHGGSMEVESEPGRGSRFTINLPWGKDIVAQQEIVETGGELPMTRPKEEILSSLEKSTEQQVILLAEDNMANILTISEYLKSHGYEVFIAHDGFEALEMVEETNPDLILMDIQMPAMDGLEATRRLRTNPRFASTPMIALTALAMPGDRERCLEAGANEYMSKPVSLKGLVKSIELLLQQSK